MLTIDSSQKDAEDVSRFKELFPMGGRLEQTCFFLSSKFQVHGLGLHKPKLECFAVRKV